MPRKIDRRQALATFGTVSLGTVLAACGDDGAGTMTTGNGTGSTVRTRTATSPEALFDGAASCSLTPEETEGPYYFDVDSIRSNIREDRKGARLRLGIRVRDATSCAPLENAVVDIWHCDAEGIYSGFESASTGGAGGPPGGGPPGGRPPGPPPGGGGPPPDGPPPRGDAPPAGGAQPGDAGGADGNGGRSDERTYLRGAQVTNAHGIVEFTTVYPGWYRGRTVHIHAKVHLDRRTVLTTQLFFDDGFTAKVYDAQPYASDTGRDTFNRNDGIFDPKLLLTVARADEGYFAAMTFDVERA